MTLGSFLQMQQRWSANEKEAYAVYQAVLKFDLYLRRGKMGFYTVITNC